MRDRWRAEIVLISIVLHSDQRSFVFESIKEEDFGDDNTRSVFRKLLKYWKENGSTDFTAVVNLMSEEEQKVIALAEAEYYPSIDVEGQVKEFNDDLTLERIKSAASRMALAQDLDEAIKLDSEIQQLSRGIVRTKPLTFKEASDVFAGQMYEEIDYIPTGYQKLDEYALIDRGDFIVLAGEQSAGKTAFSIGLMLNMAKHGYKCVYFSLETSAMGIFYRAVAVETGIPFSKILRRKFDDETANTYNEKWDELKAMPITIVEAAGWSVDRIRAEAIRLDADVIFIDYIGLIKGKGRSRYEETTSVSIDLHTMAQSAGITIVCLSQQGRGTDDSMHSLKDSGQLESDADMVIILSRKEEDRGKEKWPTDLTIAKNKKGRVGKIRMWFEGTIQRFTQMTELEEQQLKPQVVKTKKSSIKM